KDAFSCENQLCCCNNSVVFYWKYWGKYQFDAVTERLNRNITSVDKLEAFWQVMVIHELT
ncbi:hypothetical protein RYX36_018015, partial [Vicia faba]